MRRLPLHALLALALAGALTLAAPTAANAATSAASASRPGTGKPASVGGPATGTATARGTVQLAAVGIDLCAQVGYNAGFRGNSLVTAVAIAMAESSCNPSAIGYNPAGSGCPNGSLDRGLWQINNCWHPEVNDTCAYNSQCNANAAYTISYSGTYWQPWSTYNAGLHVGYLSAAQAAVDRLSGGNPTVTGTIWASPSLTIRSGPGTGYSPVGSAGYGAVVAITCYTFGEYVAGGYWPSSTWDRITNPATGATGYAADTWISTTADVKTMVGRC